MTQTLRFIFVIDPWAAMTRGVTVVDYAGGIRRRGRCGKYYYSSRNVLAIPDEKLEKLESPPVGVGGERKFHRRGLKFSVHIPHSASPVAR